MIGNNARSVALVALSVLCCAVPQQQAKADGFGFMDVEPPTKTLSPETGPQNVVFNVRTFSCLGPVTVAGKAEGRVDGQRVSIPLNLKPLGQDRYTVLRQWPEKGIWVISLFMKAKYAIGNKPDGLRMTSRLLVHPGSEASREVLATTNSTERRGVGRDTEWHTVGAIGVTGLYYRRPWGGEEASLVEATLRAIAASVPPARPSSESNLSLTREVTR